jgi:hypothetical protein
MNKTLKLYVWTGFSPDYTSGLAFAIARNEEDAREQIIKEMVYEPSTWGTLTIHRLDRRTAHAVSGGG